MKTDDTVTKVIFKKVFNGNAMGWESIAFFPGAPANAGNILAYMHTGQHGEACEQFYARCRKCSPREYAGLKRELEGLGYRLRAVHRITPKDRERAWRRATPEGDKELKGRCPIMQEEAWHGRQG